MARVLHLLKGDDPLALRLAAEQRAAGDEVAVALLPGAPDLALPAAVSLPVPAPRYGLRVAGASRRTPSSCACR